MALFSFTGKNGVSATKRTEALTKAHVTTTGDGLMMGQVLRSLIIERTQSRGVDVTGAAFAPYSKAYGKMKKELGRREGLVDLTGRNAPHMMQALIVKCGGTQVAGASETNVPANAQTQPATKMEIGFYGTEAGRAKGNNEGAGHNKKRRFFASSQKDLEIAAKLLSARIAARRDA